VLHPRIKFAGAHIHRDMLKAGIAIFPREGGLSYPRHYVPKPVIPEGGYPGGVDEQGRPLNVDNYQAWLRSLPVRMELNPCLVHFIRINPGTTRGQLESEIQRIFSPDVLATVDALLSDRSPTERESMSRFRRMMNSPERLGTKLVLPGGYDKPFLIAGAESKFEGLAGELDGAGKLLNIEPGTIDVGASAIDRSSALSYGRTFVAKDNPSNAAGTINQVEIWANTNLADCEVATFIDEGSDVLSTRDNETLGAVTSGSKQTFSGLDMDVSTGDYIGWYATGGSIEADFTTGSGYWYGGSGVDLIPCSSESLDLNSTTRSFSLYGTGDGALTEKSGSDSGTGVETSNLEASGVVSDDDAGTGEDTKASFPTAALAGSESGAGGEETAGIIVNLVSDDIGAGNDLSVSSAQESFFGDDTGSGSDTLGALIAKTGAGSEMNLPGSRGQIRMPSRGVNL
jgi:hypothetical protein